MGFKRSTLRKAAFLIASDLFLSHFLIADPQLNSQKVSTWKQALQSAYLFNPQLKIAQISVKASKDKKRYSQGEWVPTAEATASYKSTSQEYKKPIQSPSVYDSLSRPKAFGVSATQNLFASGGSVARWQRDEAGVQAALFDMYNTESSVFFEVMKIVLEIIVSRELKSFYQNNTQLSQTLLAQTRARARVGEINRTDVFMAEAKLAESEARYVEADSRLAVAKTQFFEMTGQEASENFIWPVITIDFPQGEQSLSQLALHQNFSIQAEAFRERSARKEIHSQLSSQMLPSVDLRADASRSLGDQKIYAPNQTPRFKDQSTEVSGILSLKVPIPFGRQQAVVRQAEQAFNQSRFKRQQSQLNVHRAVLEARNQRIAAEKNVARYEIELRANKRALDAMQAEYAHGGRTYINVSEIQSRKENSYQNWLEARKKEMIERLRILSLTGKLTAKHLKLDVDYYSPDKYRPWLGLAPETSQPTLLTQKD